MVSLDFTTLNPRDVYRLMIGAVVPRPIAWVSTISTAGVTNLAPFSFFNAVSASPPCLSFSMAFKSGGDKKDTLKNLEANGECVVHVVSENVIGEVNTSAAELPYETSEIDLSRLTTLPSVKVRPPRIAESKIHFECVIEKLVPIGSGKGSTVLAVVRIVQAHISDQVYRAGTILLSELAPISRLGGLDYGRTSGVFELPRP